MNNGTWLYSNSNYMHGILFLLGLCGYDWVGRHFYYYAVAIVPFDFYCSETADIQYIFNSSIFVETSFVNASGFYGWNCSFRAISHTCSAITHIPLIANPRAQELNKKREDNEYLPWGGWKSLYGYRLWLEYCMQCMQLCASRIMQILFIALCTPRSFHFHGFNECNVHLF